MSSSGTKPYPAPHRGKTSKFLPSLFGPLALVCALGCALQAAPATAAASKDSAPEAIHLGPTLNAFVQRGDQRLPIFLVDHLKKGDRLSVTTNKSDKAVGAWLLVLAAVTPANNQVDAAKFDLTAQSGEASMEISSDDQVPVIVLAPQVRTMFGLHTSFSESASLITDAVKTDPQRFVDLQKIDEINHAIAILTSALDAAIQTQKPDQAVAAAKALAAKFGVRNVDPSCFKDATVNTSCVAINIVSSKDLSLPDDMWSSSGPNAAAAKIPTDLFASLKIVTEASTYLSNKYGDNYDFAPSSGRRQSNSGDTIQLVTNARFKNGDVKTAYVYVPSWFSGKPPELTFAAKNLACLAKGQLVAGMKGLLPLTNYWHDWKLELHGMASKTVSAKFDELDFRPDEGIFSFDFKKAGSALPLNGQTLDVTLTGKFGFADVSVAPFQVTLSSTDHVLERVNGLDSLIAGEHAKLHFGGASGDACVEQMALTASGKTLATSSNDARGELSIDLSKIEPGPAMLEVQQYGLPKQELPIAIKKRKAHIQRLVHFDLETDVTAYGDNLDRIDTLQVGHDTCKLAKADDTPETPTTRVFSCPAEIAANANFPAQVTVKHVDAEPSPFDFPVTKIGARPHMTVEGNNNAVVELLSAQATQWGLGADDQLVTEDSGISMLLHAFGGYKLSRGPYVLQLKFADDPHTEQTPISVPLMSDLAHNELRTHSPINFANAQLPSVVNPIWYRVQHQPSGLVGDWLPLNRSAVDLPQLGAITCATGGKGLLIAGNQLDLIDWASSDLKRNLASGTAAQKPDGDATAALTHCEKGLCVALNDPGKKLRVKLHWIDDRVFDVTLPEAPKCAVVAKD